MVSRVAAASVAAEAAAAAAATATATTAETTVPPSVARRGLAAVTRRPRVAVTKAGAPVAPAPLISTPPPRRRGLRAPRKAAAPITASSIIAGAEQARRDARPGNSFSTAAAAANAAPANAAADDGRTGSNAVTTIDAGIGGSATPVAGQSALSVGATGGEASAVHTAGCGTPAVDKTACGATTVNMTSGSAAAAGSTCGAVEVVAAAAAGAEGAATTLGDGDAALEATACAALLSAARASATAELPSPQYWVTLSQALTELLNHSRSGTSSITSLSVAVNSFKSNQEAVLAAIGAVHATLGTIKQRIEALEASVKTCEDAQEINSPAIVNAAALEQSKCTAAYADVLIKEWLSATTAEVFPTHPAANAVVMSVVADALKLSLDAAEEKLGGRRVCAQRTCKRKASDTLHKPPKEPLFVKSFNNQRATHYLVISRLDWEAWKKHVGFPTGDTDVILNSTVEWLDRDRYALSPVGFGGVVAGVRSVFTEFKATEDVFVPSATTGESGYICVTLGHVSFCSTKVRFLFLLLLSSWGNVLILVGVLDQLSVACYSTPTSIVIYDRCVHSFLSQLEFV